MPSLDRRGAEPDERSESDEVGWWRSFASLRMTGSLTLGIPPPRLQTLASLGLDPPLLSRRGVFEGGKPAFKMLIFNKLKRRHYKRSECPGGESLKKEELLKSIDTFVSTPPNRKPADLYHRHYDTTTRTRNYIKTDIWSR